MNKRTRADLTMLFQGVLLIAVLTVIGILVFQMNDDQVVEFGDDTSRTVVNETLTTVTETGESVVNVVQCGFSNFAVTQIRNNSNTVVSAGNYTATSNGRIKSSGENAHNNTDWKVTYTFTHGGYGCNATLQSSASQYKLFTNLDLVALALIFGAIIWIIFKVVPMKFDAGF